MPWRVALGRLCLAMVRCSPFDMLPLFCSPGIGVVEMTTDEVFVALSDLSRKLSTVDDLEVLAHVLKVFFGHG